ncbi:Gamma-aminobutyric acid type B receptor subunit 1 [Holothuria leucospilota]|uniref:Gamma-aminobutyric acid type B receptor subunit 1 n=1 Tax=Holothuria leucospilota TaxID=206669 RepID=A0A9Q1CH45_HOLLE|nr:Gamma-aminobutyric acid type B receptor subunit 1 [Holothuria leucospilota]
MSGLQFGILQVPVINAQNVTATTAGNIPLYISGMFSMTNGWDGSGVLPAVELALEQINERTDILEGYNLQLVWNDSQCVAGKAPRILFDHINNEPTKLIILGAACSPNTQAIAVAAHYWNLLTVIVTEIVDKEAKNQVENLKEQQVRIIFLMSFEVIARKVFCETPSEFSVLMKRRIATWPKYRYVTHNNYMAYAFDAMWAIGLMLNNTVTRLREGATKGPVNKLEDFSYNDSGRDLSKIFFEELARTNFFGASVSADLVRLISQK